MLRSGLIPEGRRSVGATGDFRGRRHAIPPKVGSWPSRRRRNERRLSLMQVKERLSDVCHNSPRELTPVWGQAHLESTLKIESEKTCFVINVNK
jgi:hypothetical protein